MATSIGEVAGILSAEGIKYLVRDPQTIITGFGGLKHYRDSDGESHVHVVIELSENGEYVTVFAPMAYKVPESRAPLFLQACAMVQWRTKLLQFEFDSKDGEIRPVIEFPLEDARLTPRQLMRCVHGLAMLIDEFHPVLSRVITDGRIVFEEDDQTADLLSSLLACLPPEKVSEVLLRADQYRRRN